MIEISLNLLLRVIIMISKQNDECKVILSTRNVYKVSNYLDKNTVCDIQFAIQVLQGARNRK